MKRTHFVTLVERLIAAKGVTRYRVAVQAGISQGHMTKLTNGERPPTDAIIAKLAPVLNTTVRTLKKAALRDRLTPDEQEAVAEIVAEDASPEQFAHWVGVHFRNQGASQAEREAFFRQIQERLARIQHEKEGGANRATPS